MNEVLSVKDAALQYISKGWSVIPVSGKKPIVGWEKYKSEAADKTVVVEWFDSNPGAGVAVVLGTVSGIIRVDADGEAAAEYFLGMLSSPPQTAEFVTPSGGRGWLFSLPAFDVKTEVLWRGPNQHEELRIQSSGSYSVVPPSPHPSGGLYAWVNAADPAPVPRELLDVLRSSAALAAVKSLATRTVINKFILNNPVVAEVDVLLKHINLYDDRSHWRDVGYALHSISEDLLGTWINWSMQSHKFVPGDCEAIWASDKREGITGHHLYVLAESCGYRSPNKYLDITDQGNAKALARMCSTVLKHSQKWKWLAWNGAVWAKEDASKVAIESMKTLMLYRRDLAQASKRKLEDKKVCGNAPQDVDERLKVKDKTIKLIKSYQSCTHVLNGCKMAESEDGIRVNYRVFDKAPFLFNCINGTLDLRTGNLREHCVDDMLTQICPTKYNADAVCSRWEQFLCEVFDNDTVLIHWIQKLMGYCLTGDITAHILPIFHGEGRNGKSTFINVVGHVMGEEYADISLPSGFLALAYNAEHPTKYTKLHNRRFVVDLETGDGMKLNEDFVKRLTGGDGMSARHMFEDFWSFRPTHKLVLATNNAPVVTGSDTAIWARLKLVPFGVCFLGREEAGLEDTLKAEAEGILAWMVRGCQLWQVEGLGDPPAVATATAIYRSEQDIVQHFFDETLERATATDKVPKSLVTSMFKVWCSNRGIKAPTDNMFGRSMSKLNIERDVRDYKGIKIRNAR